MGKLYNTWGIYLVKPRFWGVLFHKLEKMIELNIIDAYSMIIKRRKFFGKNPLLGKWKSDREATIDLINMSTQLNEKVKQFLLSKINFGEMVLEFEDTYFTSYFDGTKDSSKYEIIHFDGNIARIRHFELMYFAHVYQDIEVNMDILIMPSTNSTNIKEVFRRMDD